MINIHCRLITLLPITKTSKWEGGVKAIVRRASSDFESLVKYDAGANYKLNPSNTDYFKYTQDVFSIYSTYNFKVKKWGIRLGARIEYTNVNGNFVSSNTKVKNQLRYPVAKHSIHEPSESHYHLSVWLYKKIAATLYL